MEPNIDNIIHPKEESLDARFARERLEWSAKIEEMNSKMKNVMMVAELMTTLYTERQRAVEYYHYLISLLIPMNRKYNGAYAERYDYYTNKVQVRYPNESLKNNRIQVDLADMIERRAQVDNHSKFIDKTISTMDNLIFAIPRRIEIEQISRGK